MRRRGALWALAALLALNAVLLVAQPGLALPRSLAGYFFGPRLVRADIVVMDGTLRQYRVDRGVLRGKQAGSLVLRELDGSIVVVPVAPDAMILIGGDPGTFSRLRRGMVVTTVREGGGPATDVRATRR
jgi:hypothetical protein